LGFGITVLNNNNKSPNSQANGAIPTINLSDIKEVIPNAAYIIVTSYDYYNFSTLLKNEGYIGSSVSVFNLTSSSNNSVPYTITSNMFLLSNSIVANETLQSLLFSNNANQSITGYVYNNTLRLNGKVENAKITFYTVSSVAVFNNSVISNVINAKENFTMPVFQYTTIFSYKNYIGIVVVNGYHYSTTLQNDSIELAKLLANKLTALK